MNNQVNWIQQLVGLIPTPGGMINLSLLVVFALFLLILGCAGGSVRKRPPDTTPPPSPVSSGIVIGYFFKPCEALRVKRKKNVCLRTAGVLVGQGDCQSGQSQCLGCFGKDCSETPGDKPEMRRVDCQTCECSEFEACSPVRVDILRPGLKHGTWKVSIQIVGSTDDDTADCSDIEKIGKVDPPSEACLVHVEKGERPTIHINDFDERKFEGISCNVAPSKSLQCGTSYIVLTNSKITLTKGPRQMPLTAQGGSIEIVNNNTLLNMLVSLEDATIEGTTFQNVEIRNAEFGSLNFRPGTAGDTAVIPDSTVPFNLSFKSNGKFYQQFLIPSDITVLARNNSLRLFGQTKALIDPDNPFLPEFMHFAMSFPFTVDFEINATTVAVQPSSKCNSICFRTPQDWLLKFNPLPRSPVLIGGTNFNTLTRDLQAIRLALQGNVFGFGNLTPLQQLNQQFVAAQLSLNSAGGSPVTTNVLWSELSCYGGRLAFFAPVTLSNGFTFTTHSMLKDLFMQAESAIHENRPVDMVTLAQFFKALNSTCR